jgi:hypothetical protein
MVEYDFGEVDEIAPAYAITIHKSQGSKFPAVVIPVATRHSMLLQRSLIYTGITRGKKLVVLIGKRKALSIAVHDDRPQMVYPGPARPACGAHERHPPAASSLANPASECYRPVATVAASNRISSCIEEFRPLGKPYSLR